MVHERVLTLLALPVALVLPLDGHVIHCLRTRGGRLIGGGRVCPPFLDKVYTGRFINAGVGDILLIHLMKV